MNAIELMKQCQGEMTQTEFASRIGISQSLLASIYSGKRRASSRVLICLARACPCVREQVMSLFLSSNSHNCDSSVTVEQ
jgi:transcriptional regulator with XRE-family HTH domain